MLELPFASRAEEHHAVAWVDDEDAVGDRLARRGAGALLRDDDAPAAHAQQLLLRLRELGAREALPHLRLVHAVRVVRQHGGPQRPQRGEREVAGQHAHHRGRVEPRRVLLQQAG